MSDGQVVFEITGDSKGINQTIKKVTGDIQSESKKWDKAASDATGNIEKSFANMAGKIVGSLAAAGIGSILLNWGKAAIEAASDLNEVQNVVDTVFGDGAAKIETWSKKAGSQFGLTETQAKKFTSTLGAMMKSSGLAGNEIVDMSTDLAGLAADMASFYNMDFETAFEKIRSGISGETMPLKQLGINMSVANLEAFALAQGLEKTFSQMDQGEQTMLRYQYLMQATSDAQGDFAKTSDSFANAQKRIETAIDSIKTKLGEPFLNAVASAADSLASFIESLTAERETTVLDDFANIDFKTEQKITDIERVKKEAEDTLAILDKIYGTEENPEQGEEAADIVAKYGVKAKEVTDYLESLGFTTDEITEKNETWLETCKRLVNTIPGLSSIINTETGEVKGGKAAVEEYITAWENGQKKIAYMQAQQQKRQALSEKYAELPGLEVDKMLWESRLKKSKEQLQQYYKEMGVTAESMKKWWNGRDFGYMGYIQAGELGLTEEQRNFLNNEATYFDNIQREAEKATKDFETQNDAYREGLKLLEEGDKLIEDLPDGLEEAGTAAAEWSDNMKEAGSTAVSATLTALQALNDYVQGVRDATAKSIESVITGFEKVNKAGDENRKKSNELANQEAEALQKYSAVWNKWGSDNEALKKMKAHVDAGGKLTKAEQEAYEALVKVRNAQKEVNDAMDQYKPEGMKAGLQSQIDYMGEYLDNLKKAQEMGLSNELLAFLSDGSTESAEYLAGLVEGGPEAAQEVDELYKELQEQKKSFTDALTDQKLAADEMYDALVQKALESVDELSLGDEAEAAMGDTVSGIAQGIADHLPEVQDAVDAIEEQLNRLAGFGFSFNLDGGGFSFGKILDGEHETGLDYVPFDGYLAGLHEGEGILTAEENRIWQRFKNGGRPDGIGTSDLDSILGNNLRGVKAGGNVYLDGRTVGQVVSAEQGRSYRALQRSGWQQ